MYKQEILLLALCWLLLPCFAQQDSKVVIVRIFPEKVTLSPGDTQQFTARGYNNSDAEVALTPEWSATGGTINQDGLYVAGSNTGNYMVMACDAKSGAQTSSTVFIRFVESQTTSQTADRIVRLEVSPNRVQLNPGETVRFSVQGYNSRNEQVRMPSRQLWQVTGGSMTADGTYQAGGAPGTYILQIKEPNGVMTTVEVTIRGTTGKVSNIKLTPAEVQLKPHGTQRFFATGYDSSGNSVLFLPNWEASGGTIDANGIYQAGNTTGSFFVKASVGENVSCTATVRIQALDISRIEVNPKSATLFPGQSQKFDVLVYNSKNQLLPVAVSWSATGGQVQSDGTFTAGRVPGHYLLMLGVENSTLEIPVVVRAEVASRIAIMPGSVALKPGETVKFQVTVYSDQGMPIETSYKWLAHGGTIDSLGFYHAGGVPGKYIVEVNTDSGLVAQASVNIQLAAQSQVMVQRVTLKPRTARITPDERVKFEAKAFDASGAEVPCNFNWLVEGGRMEGSTYVAGNQEGKFLVTVTAPSGVKENSTVIISAGTPRPAKEKPVRLVVTPSEVSLKYGEQCSFQCKVFDQNGAQTEGEFKLEATGGTLEASTYRAGNMPGTYTVVVTETTGNLRQEIKVQIFPLVTVPKGDPIVIQEWQTKQGGMLIGQILIKGRVDDERGYLLQLVLFQKDGSQKVAAQIRVQQGQSFEFEGEYVRETTTAIGLMLYDGKFNALYTLQRSN
jgi:plastocyanin